MEIVIANRSGEDLIVAVHHSGCLQPVLRDGLFQCWRSNVPNGHNGVYMPAGEVDQFDTIMAIIGATTAVAATVALCVATDGAAAPLTAEAVAADEGVIGALGVEQAEVLNAALAPARLMQMAAEAGIEVGRIAKWVSTLGGSVVALFAAGQALSGAANGYNVYVAPIGGEMSFGNPIHMWRAEAVVAWKGHQGYVVDHDFKSTPHVWSPWRA